MAIDKSITFRFKVFHYKGKYYSEERLNLLIVQSLQRLLGNIKITGQVVPSPASCWIPRDTLLYFSKNKRGALEK